MTVGAGGINIPMIRAGRTRLIREWEPEAVALQKRMQQFYDSYREYNAFRAPNNSDHFWPVLFPDIRQFKSDRRCRILEFGAGYTGFPGYLRQAGLRDRVHLTLHDVTRLNAEWLASEGDAAVIGPVSAISGEYDIIFSTCVLEHMANPAGGLEHLWRLVAAGGSLVLMSPRYDWPFYLPPSCDHLTRIARLALGIRVLACRIRTILGGNPQFLLLENLAMFHLPWTQDRDAVHLVSQYDLQAFFSARGGKIIPLHREWRGGLRDWKSWMVRTHLQICLKVVRA